MSQEFFQRVFIKNILALLIPEKCILGKGIVVWVNVIFPDMGLMSGPVKAASNLT